MSVLLECKEQFGNFNTRQKKYCEMKTYQGRLVFVDDYGLNGCKFLKTKKSVSPSTEIENLNDLEIWDVSKLQTNKETAQQILIASASEKD